MKYILSLICLAMALVVQGQHLETRPLQSPNANTSLDFQFLRPKLAAKTLVMLGEQTHMYGDMFQMKARFIEYLHKELGFTTIAMESSMYDLWKMNQNGFDSQTFNTSIWGVWGNVPEFQRLVNYIETHQLKVIGFDSQFNNHRQFIEDFFEYCKRSQIQIHLDENDFGIAIESILESFTVEEDDINFTDYEQEIQRIISVFQELPINETNYHWLQFTKNLLACSKDAYYNLKDPLTTNFIHKNHNIRDAQMADNILSYIARHPEEKLIVWADNIHIMYDTSNIKNPIAKDFVGMGAAIKATLKDKVYSIAAIHTNDSLLDLGTKKWHKTPIKAHSFEATLKQSGHDYAFVDAHQDFMKKPQDTRLLNFIEYDTMRLDQLHDAYFFFKQAQLPKSDRRQSTIKDRSTSKKSSSKNIRLQGDHVIIKGQILEKDTQQPIPFTTLILKNAEIYRVADENGFYELSVPQSIYETAMISISSMGFEAQHIPLKSLTNELFLNPKFEALDAVVVTSILSPQTVLKKAIEKKKQNHPTDPFNFYRYGHVLVNRNDENLLDLEIITKDYDEGYLSPFVVSQRVEQIKWNENKRPKRYKNSAQFFSFRQNSIRYSNILHKRKYKKFQLRFETSKSPENEGQYIIAFQTERNKWNYTNRGYPTEYSGKLFIDKESFAIIKVIENWKTTLHKEDIALYFKDNDAYKNLEQITIKEENTCQFKDLHNDGIYYANYFFNRLYNTSIDHKGQTAYSTYESHSKLYDYETKAVEEIEYYQYNDKEENSLYRVAYDPQFWDAFYKKGL